MHAGHGFAISCLPQVLPFPCRICRFALFSYFLRSQVNSLLHHVGRCSRSTPSDSGFDSLVMPYAYALPALGLPAIRRIQAAAYAARTDGGCRTRSAARPASAAPDHTIRNRWWATRSSSDRQPCLAKPPSAHQPRPFLAKPALFQRMRCGDHVPRKSQNSHAVPISRIHRCRHPGS